MKMKMLAVAAAVAMAAGSASASTITNTDGTNDFSGFDWAQGGTAYTVGFTGVTSSTFTMNYFAVATAFVLNGFNYTLPGLDTVPNGLPGGPPPTGTAYEYTIVATLNESVVSCGLTSCTFDVTGGTFDIYYDTSNDANATAGSNGTGFTDGTLIISGTVNPLSGQSFDTTTGTNSTTLTGLVNFTDTTYVNPALAGTTFTSTLQIGQAQTSYTNPGGFGGTAFSSLQTSPADLVFQADGNQSFSAAPEPASLALLGIGLFAMGWTVRRTRNRG